jgi:hypothetical protein
MFLVHVYPSHFDNYATESAEQIHVFREHVDQPAFEAVIEEFRLRRVWELSQQRQEHLRVMNTPPGPQIVYEWVENVVMVRDLEALTCGMLDHPLFIIREDYQIGSVTGKVLLPDGTEVDVMQETLAVKEGDVLVCQIRHEVWPDW